MTGVSCGTCGWVNTWEDSGDRGRAVEDHERRCSPAEQVYRPDQSGVS